MELSLDDLKTKFRSHTVTATLQCTGNRRHEINEVKPVQVRGSHHHPALSDVQQSIPGCRAR